MHYNQAKTLRVSFELVGTIWRNIIKVGIYLNKKIPLNKVESSTIKITRHKFLWRKSKAPTKKKHENFQKMNDNDKLKIR
jgi:hypothetical protein